MKRIWAGLSAILSAVTLVMLITGCETEPVGTTQVKVSPESVTISEGQAIEFTARDGFEYQWSLTAGKEQWGTLSTRQGARTVYTSMYTPPSAATDITQILTVTSVIRGAGGTNTAAGVTAQAYITHRRGT